MDIEKEISILKYNEAIALPKFKASLDRLLNKTSYDLVLSCHSISAENLLQFIDKAISDGNAVLIEKEWNGYMVILWKD